MVEIHSDWAYHETSVSDQTNDTIGIHDLAFSKITSNILRCVKAYMQ